MYGHHRDLHVLTHSFPTRRSSDLPRLHDPRRHDPAVSLAGSAAMSAAPASLPDRAYPGETGPSLGHRRRQKWALGSLANFAAKAMTKPFPGTSSYQLGDGAPS